MGEQSSGGTLGREKTKAGEMAVRGHRMCKTAQRKDTLFTLILCDHQITTCYAVPCTISAPNECLWTDWLLERKLYGYQAQHYVCMKHVDGICSWYRGHLHLRKEYVDIIQP